MLGITPLKISEALIMYVLIHAIIWASMKFLKRTERSMAIWLHHKNRALEKGHGRSVVECNEDTCVIL